jgi:hypothetical protein
MAVSEKIQAPALIDIKTIPSVYVFAFYTGGYHIVQISPGPSFSKRGILLVVHFPPLTKGDLGGFSL